MGSKKTNGSALLPSPIYSNADINEELVVQKLTQGAALKRNGTLLS